MCSKLIMKTNTRLQIFNALLDGLKKFRHSFDVLSLLTFTCSNSTIKTLEKGVKYVQR